MRDFGTVLGKLFKTQALPFKHNPKTIIKNRENLVRNYPILSPHNNRRKMYRIQLIIAVLSAGYFSDMICLLFSAYFLPKLTPHQLAAAIMPLVLNGALKTYF